jgi:DNA segregation ATPase FtsK/SpoIIIE, S-DNA-T family
MNQLNLIGKVAVEFLKKNIGSDNSEGIARFLLDRLSGSQVSVICKEILADEYLKEIVDIKIPVELAVGNDLPESIITNERTTRLRHSVTEKPVLLLANNNDDQGPSLRNIFTIGANDLKANINLWVKVITSDLPYINGSERLMNIWKKALIGLLSVTDCSLEMFSSYIVLTREKIINDGATLIDALGWALPALKIPRDSGYFYAIPENRQTYKNNWAKSFKELKIKRSYYLFKLTPTREVIENEQLNNSFDEVKEYIPEHIHPDIQNFINSKPGWTSESDILANYEWESDHIGSFFSGIKVSKKSSLSEETREFLEDEFSDLLTEEDEDYLDLLEKRKAKEPNDDDISFYEKHRYQIENNKKLKAKWDKFIYGKPIECTDFLVGFLQAIERLFAQSESTRGKKIIKVKTQKSDRRSSWLNMNTDLGLYFCTRYKGLEMITSPLIEWDTSWLFKYDELIEDERKRHQGNGKKSYKKNTSVAKTSRQIKFYIELYYEDEHGIEQDCKVQLLWEGTTNAIGSELFNDLNRLSENPFQKSNVSKNPISKKGKLQGISLSDVYTFQAVYRQNRGSLVGVYEKEKDINLQFIQELKNARAENRIDENGYTHILNSWNSFSQEYKRALRLWVDEGLISDTHVNQSKLYGELLNTLSKYAKGDINRIKLWYPIIKIGVIEINDTKPLAVIPPWNPYRMAALAVKMKQTNEIIKYLLLTEDFDFGDAKLYFNELVQDIEHPYYPEVCLGFNGDDVPEVLSITDTLYDYSLMEMPIAKMGDQETNEDPKEASDKLTDLLGRYLELQPHEGANLGVVLYNSDSTRLPQAIVDSVSKLNSKDDNIRCQVVLRHRDTNKLNQIYSKMVEGADSDPDMFVPSEVTNDFMAKLRIGVMAHQSSVSEKEEGKPFDLVFLQDVISRQSNFDWIKVRTTHTPDNMDLYPARWSRRRPSAKDELKSTTYLVCPSQTAEGWEYLKFVKSIHRSIDEEEGIYFLPSRQINFQSNETKNIFEESHKLGEWVANYDELLDRRLLKSQGVNIIKYQHNKTNGANLVVSTTTSLKLLKIILKRKFKALNLSISGDDIDKLTDYFIEEANELSGDIVLRAAKIGRYASELIGVVLSKLIIKEEVDKDASIGWYFLDDYASWLGKKEEQIADILALNPFEEDGKYYLKIIVSEAKFVDIKNVSNSKKTSKKQLIDTVSRINNALFGEPKRLDQSLWLSKISDLLVEGTIYMQNSSASIEEWRDLIRTGQVEIEIKGYSHVFVPTAIDSSDTLESEQVKINEVGNSYQEIYSRDSVRELILATLGEEPLYTVRSKFATEVTWKKFTPSLPSEKTEINQANQDEKPDEVLDKGNQNNSKNEFNRESEQLSFADTTDRSTTNEEEIDDERRDEQNSTLSNGEVQVEYDNHNLSDWIINNVNEENQNESDKEWLAKVVNSLKAALATYNLQGKVLETRLTPNAAIIRLKGSDRLRVEDIEKKKSQLLTTHALNIINVLPQPGEIVVFVERPERETISLANVWNARKLKNDVKDTNLNFVIGVKEVDGELLYLNLGGPFAGLEQHAPHTLIAGETGSGKSVLIQTLILDICATNSTDTAKIYLIDPKYGVDYQNLEELPHLAEGIVIDRSRAAVILEELVEEMESRYLRFREYKVPNLKEYNEKVPEDKKMPFIYLIHDEFADWMLIDEYKSTVSSTVQRLGVKARAAGIHLIFAAQRPDKEALPMQLRDNLGNRLILKVGSTGTSEIALGEKGAENLLGRGHLVARLSGEPSLIFAQVPFISSSEIYKVSQIIKKNN